MKPFKSNNVTGLISVNHDKFYGMKRRGMHLYVGTHEGKYTLFKSDGTRYTTYLCSKLLDLVLMCYTNRYRIYEFDTMAELNNWMRKANKISIYYNYY